MKKILYISVATVIVVIVALVIFNKVTSGEDLATLEVKVTIGNFEILVTTTGELQAENSKLITAPAELRSRNLRFGQLKIQDLIPEGTVVDSGNYVAQIDRSDADNRLKDMLDELEKEEYDLLKTKLDTTIQLRNLRDELINLEFNVEEMEITLEQSIYEPPATIRQAQINMDKATRAFNQAKKNYKLKVQQAKADMRDAEINLAKRQRQKDEMMNVLDKFTIYAPAPGMLIYHKEWGGEKRKVGSNISPWDLTVATLPDLTSMISKTYINEIDISKIKTGQEVRIGVDAFPEKEYTGKVFEVANIGEQLPNTDAKVFEVVIKVDGTDPILRPSMTTSNQIVTATFNDVIFLPLEAIHVEDSIPFVYKKNGTKQVVILGESNENEIIVEQGLKESDRLLLTIPENPEKFKLQGEELIAVIHEKARQKKLEEEAKKAEVAREAEEKEKRMMEFRELPEGMTREQIQEIMRERGGTRTGRERGSTQPEGERGSTQTEVKKEEKK
ncbi:MAG: HlyD family efflux transporter periplasmic adaptor subunit [Bacteroidetes bacterium]|nr:HlyD family efflux transporter periplasmic adaptor subunit [Bacteroidota bacterium]